MVKVLALERGKTGVSVLAILVQDLIMELGSLGSNTSSNLFPVIMLEGLGLDGQHMGPVLNVKGLGVGDRLDSLAAGVKKSAKAWEDEESGLITYIVVVVDVLLPIDGNLDLFLLRLGDGVVSDGWEHTLMNTGIVVAIALHELGDSLLGGVHGMLGLCGNHVDRLKVKAVQICGYVCVC